MLVSISSVLKKVNSLSLSQKMLIYGFMGNLTALLFFGKEYSKLEIAPSLFLNEAVNFLLLTYSFFFKSINRLKPIEILIVFSLIHLFISFINPSEIAQLGYVEIRQFMLFGYLTVGYFVIKAIYGFNEGKNLLVYLILYIALLSVLIQAIYVVYFYFSTESHPFFERNYFSPMIVVGIIVSGAFTLNIFKGLKKHIFFALVFILSLSTGHDSAYLSLIVIYLLNYFLKYSFKIKLIILCTFVLCLVILFNFINTFTDVNMYWRLLYWNEILVQMSKNFQLFLGKGFGLPYITEEFATYLNELIVNGEKSNPLYSSNLKLYTVAPHNSFITIIFHTGILGLGLLLAPLIKLFKHGEKLSEPTFNTLFLALTGASVWSFFNVILELPHSSTYYWLIFITFALELQNYTKENLYEKRR